MADDAVTPLPEIVTRAEARAAGLKRYFTGRPCRHGHIDFRYVCDHSCAECARQKSAANIKANPEKRKRHQENRKRKYHSDPSVRRAAIQRTAEWVAQNREHVRQYHKEHNVRERVKRRAQNKALRDRKKIDPEWVEKERIRNRERNRKNPEAKRSHVRKRRAALRGAEGSHNAKDVKAILARQKYKCVYCPTDLSEHGYEVDHIIPISRGGSNWPRNLQILCKPCNRSKWCKDPIDFAKEKGRLL